MIKFKKYIWLAIGSTVLLVAGCGTGLNAGDTVEVANSNGICGVYVGYVDGQKVVRDISTKKLWGINEGQAVVIVEDCSN